MHSFGAQVQWRPQEVRHARNMEYWLRNTAGSEPSQAKRVATSVELCLKFGIHILPLCALEARYGAIGLNVCPAYFVLILLYFCSSSFLEWECSSYVVVP